MKRVSFNRILLLLIISLFSFSCSSDLDFNQANDLKIEPVFISNLAYFDIPAHEFVTNGVERSIIVDSPTVDVFNDAFLKNHLTRADLSFEIDNTINRAYTLDIILRDKNNQPLYTINFNVPAYTGAANLVTKKEIFENANLDLLKSTTKMTFFIKMLSGSLLNENSVGSIKLRSGVTAYLIVQ
ncbi:hypothetical protein ACFX5E_15095 [Flavobacterium sp. LS2P90]|uniref:DUF1735 domain-containing protein n=1 Tax=Flavobacterium xylosi TaxID=3230415 RepID=A0ABW6HZM4_9FLAO